jgi:hypothetical protein
VVRANVIQIAHQAVLANRSGGIKEYLTLKQFVVEEYTTRWRLLWSACHGGV